MDRFAKRFSALLLVGSLLSGCETVPPTSPIEQIPAPSQGDEDFSMEELKSFTNGDVEIIYSAETGLPKEIVGKFSSHPILTEEDAVIALGSIRSLMGIGDLTFRCIDVDQREDSVVFRLEQLWEGIPVMEHGFRVGASADGTAQFVSGSYLGGIHAETSPARTSEECAKGLGLGSGEKIKSTELVLLEDGGAVVLCWKYHIVSNDPLQERFVCCDASDGSLVKTIPMAIG